MAGTANPSAGTAEQAVALGPVDFQVLRSIDLSSGPRWFSLRTTLNGILTLQSTSAQGQLALYDESMHELGTSSRFAGVQQLSRQVDSGQLLYFQLVGMSGSVDLRVANLVQLQGNSVLVLGTAGNDKFTLNASSRRIAINGVCYRFSEAEMSTVSFAGSSGQDTVTLWGTTDQETIHLAPGSGSLVGMGCSVTLSGSETITVYGRGGGDVASLEGSPGNDRLHATPADVRLSGEGFSNRVLGFGRVRADAGGGDADVACLFDSAGDDSFVAEPGSAALCGNGFDNQATGFERVSGYATAGGTDVARLYDSDGVDTLVATPSYARLYGEHYRHQANGFEFVHAFGTPGNGDVAWLHDSPGDDRFEARPEQGRLWGQGFNNRARYFDAVYALSTAGGHDVAVLHDSAGDDRFVGAGADVRLSGSGFSHRASNFQEVYALADSGGYDRAWLYGSQSPDQVVAADNWVELYDTEETYVHFVSAFDEVGVSPVPFGEVQSPQSGDKKDVKGVDFELNLGGTWRRNTAVVFPMPQIEVDRGDDILLGGQNATLGLVIRNLDWNDLPAAARGRDLLTARLQQLGARLDAAQPETAPATIAIQKCSPEALLDLLQGLGAPSAPGQDQLDQAYVLDIGQVDGRAVLTLTAGTDLGLYYGLVSLCQLLDRDEQGNLYAPGMAIADWPDIAQRLAKTSASTNPLDRVQQYADWLPTMKLNLLGLQYHGSNSKQPEAEFLQTIATISADSRRDGVLGTVVYFSPFRGDEGAYDFRNPEDIQQFVTWLEGLLAQGARGIEIDYNDWPDNVSSVPPQEIINRVCEAIAVDYPGAYVLYCPPTPTYFGAIGPELAETLAAVPENVWPLWTGMTCLIDTLRSEDVQAWAEEAGRPPFLWINRVFAEGTMTRQFGLDSSTYVLRGNDLPPDLAQLVSGIHLNAGIDAGYNTLPAEFSTQGLVCLATAADYAWNPDSWRTAESYRRAERMVGVMMPLV